MRNVVAAAALAALAGCTFLTQSDYGEALCVAGSACSERKAERQRLAQAAQQARVDWRASWVDGEEWEEAQLNDLQNEMQFHFKRSVITCYLNHFYEDYTPKSLMAAVAEADATLGLQVPTGTTALAANLREIKSQGGEFMVSLSDACRREVCAAVAEKRREVEGKGMIYMEVSGACDDR